MIKKYKEFSPKIHETAYIAENAVIDGDCEIGINSSIWYNAVLRGDDGKIVVGDNSNVQDGAVVHSEAGMITTIGDCVTVGHLAIIHGCTIKGNCIVGMGSTILNNAIIEENCIIGANSLVTGGKTFPKNSLIMGSPAKLVRELNENEIEGIKKSASHYLEFANNRKL